MSEPYPPSLSLPLWYDFGLALLAGVVVISCLFAPAGVICAAVLALVLAAALATQAVILWMVFLLPFTPLIDVGLPLHDVGTALRILVFAAFLGHELFRGRDLKRWLLRGRFEVVLLIYLAVALLSVLISHNATHSSYRSLLQLLSYVAFYFLLTGWEIDRHLLSRMLRALLASTFILCLLGFYQAIVGGYTDIFRFFYPPDLLQVWRWSGRITSSLNYSNSLAGYLNLVTPVAIGALIEVKSRKIRLVTVAILLCILLALFLAQSRGGLVAYAIVVFLAMHYLIDSRRLSIAMIVIVALLLAIAVPAMLLYSDHFVDIDSVVGRAQLWTAAVQMFWQHPWLGIGYGAFRDSYQGMVTSSDLEENQLDSHNFYLQTLAETGVIGFFLMMGLLFRAAWSSRRVLLRSDSPEQRILAFYVMAAVVGVLAHGAVDYLFQASPQFGSLFFGILAMVPLLCECSLEAKTYGADDLYAPTTGRSM